MDTRTWPSPSRRGGGCVRASDWGQGPTFRFRESGLVFKHSRGLDTTRRLSSRSRGRGASEKPNRKLHLRFFNLLGSAATAYSHSSR